MSKREICRDAVRECMGRNIRAARLKRGVSQSEFGTVLGLQQAAVCRIELGRQSVPAHLLPVLCDFLEIRVLELYDTAPESGAAEGQQY